MTSLRHLIILIVVLLLFCTCGQRSTDYQPPRELTNMEKAVVESGNEFGLNLFKQVVASHPDENLCISPLSVAIALGMTYNGARGTTKEAMDSVLGLTGLDIVSVNQAYQSLIDLLQGMDPHVTFELANSIWYLENFPISRDFVDLNREYFRARVAALDFGAPEAANTINNWITDNTHGRITEVIQPPIDQNTVMLLINAIYFLADWQHQFDPRHTYEADFHISEDLDTTCQMMALGDMLNVCFAESGTVLNLPYGNGLFSMLVILPNWTTSVNDVIAGLTPSQIADWQSDFDNREVQLRMPKFQMEYYIEPAEQLADLGLGILFDPNNANLSGMLDRGLIEGNLFVNKVQHKTFIKVDEEGTEAAAVTVVSVSITSPGPEVHVNLDRPFAFLIIENHSNTILFAGKVVRPEWP